MESLTNLSHKGGIGAVVALWTADPIVVGSNPTFLSCPIECSWEHINLIN